MALLFQSFSLMVTKYIYSRLSLLRNPRDPVALLFQSFSLMVTKYIYMYLISKLLPNSWFEMIASFL